MFFHQMCAIYVKLRWNCVFAAHLPAKVLSINYWQPMRAVLDGCILNACCRWNGCMHIHQSHPSCANYVWQHPIRVTSNCVLNGMSQRTNMSDNTSIMMQSYAPPCCTPPIRPPIGIWWDDFIISSHQIPEIYPKLNLIGGIFFKHFQVKSGDP